jgi:PhzF family phenazine biosynthesis protein
MWREVYSLSAFTKDNQGGNPAGAVLETVGLSESDMRDIAGKLGYSETAFVFKSDIADFKIRYFTPNEEVDVCGHATIATFSLMQRKGLVNQGTTYQIETKSGLLNVSVNQNQSVFLEQNPPVFREVIPKAEIAYTLGLHEDHLMEELPVQIVSTGLRDIIVPVTSLEVLKGLHPKYDLITEVSRKYHVIGYHVFTSETIGTSTAHCRNFAPLYGIKEESATGTANAALACYIAKYKGLSQQPFVFEQGYGMNSPSEIVVNLTYDHDTITSVSVGGFGSRYETKRIKIEDKERE